MTALDARGMYSGNRKMSCFVLYREKEIAQLKELVVGHDAQAFVIVSDAREVLGEGFIEYRQLKPQKAGKYWILACFFSAKCIKIYDKGPFRFVRFYKTGRYYEIRIKE